MFHRNTYLKTNISNIGFFPVFFVNLIIIPCNFHLGEGGEKTVYEGG